MIIHTLEILQYWTADGKCPYKEWFDSLKDAALQQTIDARLTRVERGLLGDVKWIGNGVFELKFRIGPGYRIYFGRQGRRLIILLCGGDKSSQKNDIKRALQYWADFLGRSKK